MSCTKFKNAFFDFLFFFSLPYQYLQYFVLSSYKVVVPAPPLQWWGGGGATVVTAAAVACFVIELEFLRFRIYLKGYLLSRYAVMKRCYFRTVSHVHKNSLDFVDI